MSTVLLDVLPKELLGSGNTRRGGVLLSPVGGDETFTRPLGGGRVVTFRFGVKLLLLYPVLDDRGIRSRER